MRPPDRPGHSGIDAALADVTTTMLRSAAQRRQLRQWRPRQPLPPTTAAALHKHVFSPHRTVPLTRSDVWWLLHTVACHPLDAQVDEHTRCRSIAAAAPGRFGRVLDAPARVAVLHLAITTAINDAARAPTSVCIGLLWHDIRHLRYNVTPLRGGPTRSTAVINRWRTDIDIERNNQ